MVKKPLYKRLEEEETTGNEAYLNNILMLEKLKRGKNLTLEDIRNWAELAKSKFIIFFAVIFR